jgi:hypothetical protein
MSRGVLQRFLPLKNICGAPRIQSTCRWDTWIVKPALSLHRDPLLRGCRQISVEDFALLVGR